MRFIPTRIWTEFLPREVSQISGVSLPLLRDWRRRGYLPQGNNYKWNKLEALEVAALLVMKELSAFGIGPKVSKNIATRAANTILYFALQFESSVEFTGESISEKMANSIRETSVPVEYNLWEPRYLIISKAGKGELSPDLDSVFDDKMWLIDGHEIAVIIDLPSLAVKMLEATNKPILKINITEENKT